MKRVLILILVLTTLSPLSARNLPSIDYKAYHFGFSLGFNVLDFGIIPSGKIVDGKVYNADIESIIPGFSIGLLGDMRLNNYFSLRVTPTLMLSQRTLTFVNNIDDDTYKSRIKSTIITLPVYLKYQSVRILDFRGYVMAGGGLLYDMTHDQTQAVLLHRYDAYWDVAVGATFYMEYFRLSPELHFGMGMTNILTPLKERDGFVDPDYRKYNDALDKLTTRLFSITFNFE